MTEREEELLQEELEKQEATRKKLKVGGGSLAAVGGLLYGVPKVAEVLNNKRLEKIKDGTFMESKLSKLGLPATLLTAEELNRIKYAKTAGKIMAAIGGTTYGGVKLYEHFKNKRKKNLDE